MVDNRDTDTWPWEPMRRSRAKDQFARVDLPVFVNRPVVNGAVVPHGYEDFLMLSLIVTGRGIHRTIHGDENVREGDVLFTWAGGWHAYHDCRALEVRNLAVGLPLIRHDLAWLSREPELAFLFSKPPLAGDSGAVGRISRRYLRRCVRHHDHIVELLERNDHPIDVIAGVLLFFARLAEGLREHRPADAATSAGRRVSDERIHHLMNHVENRLEHGWLLDELAAEVHLERSYFVRLFRSVAGLAPMQYLKQRRLHAAAALLLRTAMSVQQVGQRVGMAEPAVFSRAFRARFGVSPSEYRRRMVVKELATRSARTGAG